MTPRLATAITLATTLAGTSSAADQVVTLGDSLTFAYEAEFGFDLTIQGLGSFGDGFGPEVKNWIEILGDPAYRGEDFDQGGRDEITLPVSFLPPRTETIFLRRAFNWAVPGIQIDDLRRFLLGEVDLLELLGESEEFALVSTALGLSDFSVEDFDVLDLATQIGSEAERVVVFIGGNDVNSVYETVYDGGSPGSFVPDFVDDMRFILDWVLARNPAVPVVLVSVPHVGITPDVKSTHPTDPLKTGRVTAMLRDLNAQLAGLASERGLGFADAFTATLPLLGPDPFPVFGVPFANSGSETGDLAFSWLDGELSYNFHPNTNVQALLANEIIHAFNRTYGAGIAPLSTTEVLASLLGTPPASIDMPFSSWASAYGLPGIGPADDSDLDRLTAGLEFALGLNPTLQDSDQVSSGPVHGEPAAVEIVYPVRLPASTQVSLTPAMSPDLGRTPFSPIAADPDPLPDGRRRAVLPADSGSGFLRLESTATPSP